jgi:hypothetical protein
MSKKIPYENPVACPNCLSVSIVPPVGLDVHPGARLCVHCDHSWNLHIPDLPPECVLVRMPDNSIGVMFQVQIPTIGYATRRQAELFAWANYGMIEAPPASSGRWEAAAKRARDAWIRSQEEVLKGLQARMALLDIILTSGVVITNGKLFIGAEYVGTVDPVTEATIEDLRREAEAS